MENENLTHTQILNSCQTPETIAVIIYYFSLSSRSIAIEAARDVVNKIKVDESVEPNNKVTAIEVLILLKAGLEKLTDQNYLKIKTSFDALFFKFLVENKSLLEGCLDFDEVNRAFAAWLFTHERAYH